MNVSTTQAVLTCRIVYEHFVFIPVITIQPILRSEPNKSLIVLYDLKNSGLGQSLCCREPREADIVAIDHGNSNESRAAMRLLRRSWGSRSIVSPCHWQPTGEGNQWQCECRDRGPGAAYRVTIYS